MAGAVNHPSAQELAAYGLGKLPQGAATEVASHLEACPACRKAVASQPPDSFVGKVRAAKPGASAIPMAVEVSRASASTTAAVVAALPEYLPEQLANHPEFRILRVLGRGGMGVIYLAEHRVMEKPVALKVISPAMLDNPDALARFHGEAKAAGRLDHPNIARAYDADQAGELHFLVMEFVEGVSLAQLLEQKGTLRVAHACHYTRQAALGLQHAFERDMVHRDIKPQNLMLTPKGVVKVLDFGLARLRSERAAGGGLTQADAFMGTPEYVSPEQATDARQADTRADIYSLGCTLYALLAGRPPFQENTAIKLVLAHIEKEPQPLHELRPDVPAELVAVVARMLAKDPAQRYQKPIEVAKALEQFIKPGAKREAGAVPAPPKGVASPEKGTMVSADTSKIHGLRESVAVQAAAREAPAKEETPKPFENLGDAVISPKKVKKTRGAATAMPVAWYRRWQVIVGGVVAILLLGLVGLWAGGVFKVKTKDGTIVLKDLPADAEVLVDGDTVTVKWNGKTAEIRVAPGKKHRIQVKKDGVVVFGDEVEVDAGGSKPLLVYLEKIPPHNDPSDGFKSGSNGKELSPPPSAALEALRRDQIAPDSLKMAGDGDPNKAPASLVGVLGEALPIHSQRVAGLAFSADNRWLASGSFDKSVFLWDMATGRVRRVLQGHTGPVSSVAFSKDGRTLVSASHDGTLKLWPVQKEAESETLQPKLGEVWAMAASPDGRFLAAAGSNRVIKLWKWGQWDKPVELSALPDDVGEPLQRAPLAFSPDGDLLACGGWGAEGLIGLYQTSDGKLTRSWAADKTPLSRKGSHIFELAFHRDGKWLASLGGDPPVKLWEVASGKFVAERGDWTACHGLTFHPDGKTLYACLAGNRGWIIEVPAIKVQKEFLEPDRICSAAYSPDGKLLAFGTDNGGVHVLDTTNREKQLPKHGHSHCITALAVGPDGRTVLSGGDDNALRRWDVGRPRESQLLHKFDRIIHDVAYSPNGRTCATTASFEHYDTDQRGVVWDAATGKQVFAVEPRQHVYKVVFSPNGKLLAACGHRTGCVHLWDANSGKELHRFPKTGVCLDRPAFSADGKQLVGDAGSYEG